MNHKLTQKEIGKIMSLCFENPVKACAIAQEIIVICQIVSCSTYSEIKGKSKRTIQYKAEILTGIEIENRKYISLNQ